MKIMKPVGVSLVEIKGVLIAYPSFLHRWGNNDLLSQDAHVYRGNFSLHLIIEKLLLGLKNHLEPRDKLFSLLLIVEGLLGLNCGFPFRDIVLYLLWLKGHYLLPFNDVKAGSHIFYTDASGTRYHANVKRDLMVIRAEADAHWTLKNQEILLINYITDVFTTKDDLLKNIDWSKMPTCLPYNKAKKALIFWRKREA